MNLNVSARHQSATKRLRAPGGKLRLGLGQAESGIDILTVQPIRGCETPPCGDGPPAFINGVLKLRGVVVPSTDLRLKSNLPEPAVGGFAVPIILDVARRAIGIVVDGVSDVVGLGDGRRRQAPEFNTTGAPGHRTGLCAVKAGDRERLRILTEIEALVCCLELDLVKPDQQIH